MSRLLDYSTTRFYSSILLSTTLQFYYSSPLPPVVLVSGTSLVYNSTIRLFYHSTTPRINSANTPPPPTRRSRRCSSPARRSSRTWGGRPSRSTLCACRATRASMCARISLGGPRHVKEGRGGPRNPRLINPRSYTNSNTGPQPARSIPCARHATKGGGTCARIFLGGATLAIPAAKLYSHTKPQQQHYTRRRASGVAPRPQNSNTKGARLSPPLHKTQPRNAKHETQPQNSATLSHNAGPCLPPLLGLLVRRTPGV